MRPAAEPASVTLIIQKIGYDDNPLGRPYQVEKYEDFASKPFEELLLMVTDVKIMLAFNVLSHLNSYYLWYRLAYPSPTYS